MKFSTIIYEQSSRGVATITINRPERGNALNQVAIEELGECFTHCATNNDVRVVVLRGAGKHFCAGADMGGRAEGAPSPKFTLASMMEVVDTCIKPTLAVVQGAAVGGGMALASACDVILSTSEAFFSIPEVRLGIVPSPVLSALFMRAVGYRHFRRYGFSGERIAAARAMEIGFVSEIFTAAELETGLASLIEAMLRAAPHATAKLKAKIADYCVPSASQLYAPQSRDAAHVLSLEAQEGMAAFKEKRNPSWYHA